ncbi:MAG: TIGR03987 family protein [Propionibacteriales bacterium]|nr:TIGR03987 family protein [Propionibacteriales bacterium]
MFWASLVIINLALVCYSIGVWAERIQRRLKPWHVAFFGLGLTADATGTALMVAIAQGNAAAGMAGNGAQDLMAWTGTIAIVLMALHLIWALVTVIRNREPELLRFHTFSIVVWVIWLVPYLAGAVASMVP